MIEIRVSSKTAADEFRTIVQRPDGTCRCDCGGFDGIICSHIDAVIIAGERFMVYPDDRALADTAMAQAQLVTPPIEWKGAWRRNLRWRGLSTRAASRRSVGHSGRPIVCFTGAMPRSRKEYHAEAVTAGWEVVDAPNKSITVLVAADPLGSSRKLASARIAAIPIVSLEDWAVVMIDGVFPE